MIRKAINVVLTLGLVGTVILGVATLVVPRPIIWKKVSITVTVHRCVFSAVRVSKSDKKLSPYRFGTNWCFVQRIVDPASMLERAAFLLDARYSGRQPAIFHVQLPLWIPFVLFGAYPTFALFRGPLRRRRRRRRGQCIGCGYDLTGNESGVCPECGSKTDVPRDG